MTDEQPNGAGDSAPEEAFAPPGPGAPAGRPRVNLEALAEKRTRFRRRLKRAAWIFGTLAVLAFLVLAGDRLITQHYRGLYEDQAWIEIARFYDDEEKGKILEVNRQRIFEEMDRRFLGREVRVLGRVTRLKEREEPTGAKAAEVVVDVPNFVEPVNFHDDEVYVEFPGGTDVAALEGRWVLARGIVLTYGKYRLRLRGISIRPLASWEEHYVRRVLPPTQLTRQPIGFEEFFE